MKLRPPNQTQDIELGDLKMTVIPAGQFLRDLAQTNGRRRARDMIENADLWREYGLENTAMSEIFAHAEGASEAESALSGGEDVILGYGTHVYAVELALLVLKAWSPLDPKGVFLDEAGQPAAVTRRNISLLFLDAMPGEVTTYASGFVRKVHQLTSLERSEGKP